MGGGDLNLKKSWHPQTFHNLERVWKAQQKDEREKKKIQDLQQEIREERAREEMQRMAVESGITKKKDECVEWLYRGPGSSVNREEYLLGKKIDKAVDPTLVEEEREREALASGPGALFTPADAAGSAADIAIKVREDPLFLIKKKEEEAKRLLSSNPVKMKQLQQLVSKEKHKKSKKKRRAESPKRRAESPKRRAESPKRRAESPKRVASHHKSSEKLTATRVDRRNDEQSSEPKKSHRSVSRHHPYSRSHTRRMDPDELERRRQAMMADAREHGREREGRLRRHQEDKRREEQDQREAAPGDFLQPLRVQSLSSSQSVQERIHRHIGSVQRTSAALDSNFMHRK